MKWSIRWYWHCSEIKDNGDKPFAFHFIVVKVEWLKKLSYQGDVTQSIQPAMLFDIVFVWVGGWERERVREKENAEGLHVAVLLLSSLFSWFLLIPRSFIFRNPTLISIRLFVRSLALFSFPPTSLLPLLLANLIEVERQGRRQGCQMKLSRMQPFRSTLILSTSVISLAVM
jgi:hypothetical protein